MLAFKPWKSFEFECNRHLNNSALGTGIRIISFRVNMVLDSSSPIKKDNNHEMFASDCRCKREMEVIICSFSF